jgi:hypothetical protein
MGGDGWVAGGVAHQEMFCKVKAPGGRKQQSECTSHCCAGHVKMDLFKMSL